LNKKLFLSLIFIFPFAVQAESDGLMSAESLFVAGNSFYEAREFDSAIVYYAEALIRGKESAAIYFNLGNSYFKNGDLGRSILYYKRAQRLEPSDDDIFANLEFAQNFTVVQMEGVQLSPVSDFLERLVGSYHINNLAWLLSLFFVSLFILLSIRFGLGFRTSLLKTGIVTCLSLTIIFSMLTTFKYRNDYLRTRAVLIARECPVRSGPNEQSELELQGGAGLIVDILSESGEYYNVLFENKRRGWLKKELVAVI